MTADLAVAAGFVLAAVGEAIALHWGDQAQLAFAVSGAPVLAVLALRRSRPVLSLCMISAGSVLGVTVQTLVWPGPGDGGGVWLFALMFAAYSLGAHARGRALVLGWLAPLAVGAAVDLQTMAGAELVKGIVFLAAFIGFLPTTVGWLTRVWRDRLALLDRQHEALLLTQQSGPETAVLAERLRATQQLQAELLDGLRSLARAAATGAEPGEIERTARQLLGGVRTQVVALTSPVATGPPTVPVPAPPTAPLRAAAQRWVVLGAGVIGVGFAFEPARASETPTLVVVASSVIVCLPLALLWWRPLPTLVVAWCAVSGFSRLVTPMDGTLSGTAVCLATAFAIAALCHRRAAIVGLAICVVGQVVGVGAADPFGEAIMMFVCWLGGMVAGEVRRLVERGRENNRLLVRAEAEARELAVVGERLRLAREIHDQIGHSLTVVALQAAAARRMKEAQPDQASQVMVTITGVIQDGLAAMAGHDAHDLAALVRRTRDAGLAVTTELTGLEPCDAVDTRLLALTHRVVQEALTNVLRHAPGASAAVVVRRESGALTVEISNNASRQATPTPGLRRGLVGLRAHVCEHGGQLSWGPSEVGGFVVRATLPVCEPAGVLL